jgi:hypothetical protein
LWANEKVPRQNDVVAIAENYFKNVLVSSSEQTAPVEENRWIHPTGTSTATREAYERKRSECTDASDEHRRHHYTFA